MLTLIKLFGQVKIRKGWGHDFENQTYFPDCWATTGKPWLHLVLALIFNYEIIQAEHENWSLSVAILILMLFS